MSSKRFLVFVCPRYPTRHAGGAEVHCRRVAERMAARGHRVELLATTAEDHFSWKGEGGERSFDKNGIRVRLFAPDPREALTRFHEIERKIAEGISLSAEEERIWLANSVNSRGLYDHIESVADAADYFIFMPYLFGLTINGAKIRPEKTLLIPCLHEENFAHLSCIRELFRGVRGILFNSPPEMELARKWYDLPSEKLFLVSLGFERRLDADPGRFRERFKIDQPYLTFAGRREEGKNFFLLLEMTRLFQRIYPGRVVFVTMGSPPVPLEETDRGQVFDLGFVSEQDKADCFAGALMNCQPSTNESLSITVMESWLYGRPVLVNRRCDVTAYWADLSRGGLAFSDYFEFEQIVVFALEYPDIAAEMGRNGREFVESNFHWDRIVSRFEHALEKISA
jgi:glycosyltransferase involved in cell wall biosynthesis